MIQQSQYEQISAFEKAVTKIKSDDFKWKKLEQRMEIEVNQDMINYINYPYSEEVTYWRKAALDSILTKSEEKN